MLYKILGMMSGTSLDGLDMAAVEFSISEDANNNIDYRIIKTSTIGYTPELRQAIIDCETMSGEQLVHFSMYLGHFFGKQARKFLDENNLTVDFIASHGQTIFHQPSKGFTLQIGDINAIASQTHITTIGDFRSLDVALGGQGAPLVPIGDKLLFGQYPCCLNIGGFSNISYDKDNKRIAFDICPSNIVLNLLCERIGLDYDKNGEIAKANTINKDLLNKLNSIPYYINNKKHSLAKEFVKSDVLPIIDKYDMSVEDKIATYSEHIATQIAKQIVGDTFVTGGGAYNNYILNAIKSKTDYKIIVPDNEIIEYKEALIFAFLGLRRMRKEINCLKEVTGAEQDSCSGLVATWVD